VRIGITCYPTYGGSGAVATELGMALAQRGHEVHFVTYKLPFRLQTFLPRVHFHEVDVGRYPLFEYPPYDLALAVRMHEVVRDHKLDVLHCHYAIPHATSAWITKEMLMAEGNDVAVVTTLHGTDITIVGQDPSFHSITKFSIEKSDALTAVSDYLLKETRSAFGCASCRIDVIPNFIDASVYNRKAYDPALVKSFGGDRKIVMHVSNFRPVKRVKDVVQVFARVNKAVPSVLVMVGDGPDRHEAEQEARNLGVESSVYFAGKIERVVSLLASADLFILPTDAESFGLSALEALASGTPVIGTNKGGLPEVVQHGVTGSLHAVGDVDAMAAVAIEILKSPAKWLKMSNAAAEDARTRFAMDDIVGRYEQVYRDAVSKTPDTSHKSPVTGRS
jgi:N-acetyl-alpha-D-glucosaminyl L-malate synthase BshA